MNINKVLDQNFSLLIGSDDRRVPRNKMATLEVVNYITTITTFTLPSPILYLWFVIINGKLSDGQYFMWLWTSGLVMCWS